MSELMGGILGGGGGMGGNPGPAPGQLNLFTLLQALLQKANQPQGGVPGPGQPQPQMGAPNMQANASKFIINQQILKMLSQLMGKGAAGGGGMPPGGGGQIG